MLDKLVEILNLAVQGRKYQDEAIWQSSPFFIELGQIFAFFARFSPADGSADKVGVPGLNAKIEHWKLIKEQNEAVKLEDLADLSPLAFLLAPDRRADLTKLTDYAYNAVTGKGAVAGASAEASSAGSGSGSGSASGSASGGAVAIMEAASKPPPKKKAKKGH